MKIKKHLALLALSGSFCALTLNLVSCKKEGSVSSEVEKAGEAAEEKVVEETEKAAEE